MLSILGGLILGGLIEELTEGNSRGERHDPFPPYLWIVHRSYRSFKNARKENCLLDVWALYRSRK